jgi:hypothetical protein
VLLISIASLLGTLAFVKLIKAYAKDDDTSYNEAIIYDALNGKIAVSVNIPLAYLPMELLYPGVAVDLTESLGDDLNYLVRDVSVVGLSIIEAGTMAKVTVAVSSAEGEEILNAKQDKIRLFVKGDRDKNTDDIEIIEF